MHLQFPPILLNHDHNLLHHLPRGGKGEGRGVEGGRTVMENLAPPENEPPGPDISKYLDPHGTNISGIG